MPEPLLTGLALIGATTCAWALLVAVVSMVTGNYDPTELDG